MYIKRDIRERLRTNKAAAQLILGPRQCGKSTLLYEMTGGKDAEINFDDFKLRNLAEEDPHLLLEQYPPPVILDEVQYAPKLFPEMKLRIDQQKRQRLKSDKRLETLYRMTGSNILLMEKNVKESLAGRISYFYLNTLTVHEILSAHPDINITKILYQGGWPELYIDDAVNSVQYLNDYIRSYIEKDIVLSAGIQKQTQFNTVLGLLAARTAMLLDYNNLANDSGVAGSTIKDWVSILQRAQLISHLKPHVNNLNKRLTKTPKLYFLDTGLAVRLQGWQEQAPLLTSPHMGTLFETLVYAEIYKFIENYGKSWQLSFWRTKDGEEIDFLIKNATGDLIALEAKLSPTKASNVFLPPYFAKAYPEVDKIYVVTLSGQKLQVSDQCTVVPIAQLHDLLLQF